MFKRLAFVLCALTITVGTLPVQADIYAYRDENGVTNYTNVRPFDPRYNVVVVRKEPKPIYNRVSSNVYYHENKYTPMHAIQPSAEVEAIVSHASEIYQVEKALVQAVIHAESAYNPNAISRKGARGLMQLMPETAQRYGVRDVFNPIDNVTGGVRYMRDLLQMFGQNLTLAVAAYNAGENAVLRYGGVPPYPETVQYVNRVLQLHSQYRSRV